MPNKVGSTTHLEFLKPLLLEQHLALLQTALQLNLLLQFLKLLNVLQVRLLLLLLLFVGRCYFRRRIVRLLCRILSKTEEAKRKDKKRAWKSSADRRQRWRPRHQITSFLIGQQLPLSSSVVKSPTLTINEAEQTSAFLFRLCKPEWHDIGSQCVEKLSLIDYSGPQKEWETCYNNTKADLQRPNGRVTPIGDFGPSVWARIGRK